MAKDVPHWGNTDLSVSVVTSSFVPSRKLYLVVSLRFKIYGIRNEENGPTNHMRLSASNKNYYRTSLLPTTWLSSRIIPTSQKLKVTVRSSVIGAATNFGDQSVCSVDGKPECALETASTIDKILTFRKSNAYLKKFATSSHGYPAVEFKATCTTCCPTTLPSTKLLMTFCIPVFKPNSYH